MPATASRRSRLCWCGLPCSTWRGNSTQSAAQTQAMVLVAVNDESARTGAQKTSLSLWLPSACHGAHVCMQVTIRGAFCAAEAASVYNGHLQRHLHLHLHQPLQFKFDRMSCPVQVGKLKALEAHSAALDQPLQTGAPDWSGAAAGWGAEQTAQQVLPSSRHNC